MDEVGVFRTRDFRARDENSSSFSGAFLINQNKKISTHTHTRTHTYTYADAHVHTSQLIPAHEQAKYSRRRRNISFGK